MEEKQVCAFRTSIGGQALIEGILMRGPEKQAIVVRDQNGQLVEKVETLKLVKDRYPVLGLPLIRGTVNFLAAMVQGVRALMYSAEFYPDEDDAEPSKFDKWLEAHIPSKKLEELVIVFAVVLGIGMSLFLFLMLPTLLTGALLHFFPGFPLWGRNVLEGLLKIAIFLLYLIFCSRQKDIYRVFQYHGGECAGTVAPPPALRDKFPVCGDFRLDTGFQRGIRNLAYDKSVVADAGTPDSVAACGGHYVRVQPLGGAARTGKPPRKDSDGPRNVDAEFHNQRTRRRHDGMRNPRFATGDSRRKRERRMVIKN